MNNVRIMHILLTLDYGGAERFVANTLELEAKDPEKTFLNADMRRLHADGRSYAKVP